MTDEHYCPEYAVRYTTRTGASQWKPTLSTLQECEEEYTGFCLACGDRETTAEPDARKYKCEACGAHKVYGPDELALMGLCAA